MIYKLEQHICPKCGQTYIGRSALSRTDNSMLICTDCGIREALESIGIVDTESQNRVIALAKDYSRKYKEADI